VLIAVADHFEPSVCPEAPWSFADRHEQLRRLDHWCRKRPQVLYEWRDADGYPLRHTYFFPAEQYDPDLIDQLAAHCCEGWGEIEVHLHHGRQEPDSAENTGHVLQNFVSELGKRGCLSRWDGQGPLRYAFVHGNWALANSGSGRFCGVDAEMQILAETGCYADMTFPSAPSPTQVAKINSLYECALPLDQRAPHRRGRDLKRGSMPTTFPLIVQGPLLLSFMRRGRRLPKPRIENGEWTAAHPPTLDRLRLWRLANVTVCGRPDWVFVKLHCHGMDPRDQDAMFGSPLREFLKRLIQTSRESGNYQVHFVTAREMVNIILAACDGRDGNPNTYRDYRLNLARPRP
jgi:hypothetical protein